MAVLRRCRRLPEDPAYPGHPANGDSGLRVKQVFVTRSTNPVRHAQGFRLLRLRMRILERRAQRNSRMGKHVANSITQKAS